MCTSHYCVFPEKAKTGLEIVILFSHQEQEINLLHLNIQKELVKMMDHYFPQIPRKMYVYSDGKFLKDKPYAVS
jgi:hypothetical protein